MKKLQKIVMLVVHSLSLQLLRHPQPMSSLIGAA